MPHAAVLIRPGSGYRPDKFGAGLRRFGYSVSNEYKRQPEPDDLLLIWNRSRCFDPIALIYERHGARVVVAENGYIGETAGQKPYALALGHHNGPGRWYVGDAPRFIPPQKPWRESGNHILVMPQRGVGPKGVAMPGAWPRTIMAKLREMTDRPIRMRKHPGADRPDPWPDLIDAHAVVTWGSGGGIKSIAHGVPVFHDLPGWIGGVAANPLVGQLEICSMPCRERLWHIVSWAQWTAEELASGVAFEGLLRAGNSDLFCAKQP